MFYLIVQSWSHGEKQVLLNSLSDLLFEEDLALITARCFQPVILELLLRAEEKLNMNDREVTQQCQRFSYNISILLQKWPHLIDFVVSFFKRMPLFFESIIANPDESSTFKLLAAKTAYNLLRFKTETFIKICRWGAFFLAMQHSNVEIQWYATQVIAMLTCMDEKRTSSLIDSLFTPEEKNRFVIDMRKFSDSEFGSNGSYTNESFDDNNSSEHCESRAFLTEQDLSGSYTCVFGMVLPKGPDSICNSSLVMVDSTLHNLHSLVLAVATGSGVLLKGPVGCGKTSLVECLAAMTGRIGPPSLLKVQLGDQTDSKVLYSAR